MVAPIHPPEAYFPFIDAWLRTHADGAIYVATDDAAYLERIIGRYAAAPPPPPPGATECGWGRPSTWRGRVLFSQRGWRGAPSDLIARAGATRGTEAIVDALLLSHVDFLIKSSSALAEFAIWLTPTLQAISAPPSARPRRDLGADLGALRQTAHIDLQWEESLKALPPWARHVDAENYCAALARGCDLDRARSGGRPSNCARCQPRVNAAARRAAAAAFLARAGGDCASRGGRTLTHAECVAYAKLKGVPFIGSQREAAEFPGCLFWGDNKVEFNAAGKESDGCRLGGRGRCLCTTQGVAARNYSTNKRARKRTYG